jgi:hypothetical protein
VNCSVTGLVTAAVTASAAASATVIVVSSAAVHELSFTSASSVSSSIPHLWISELRPFRKLGKPSRCWYELWNLLSALPLRGFHKSWRISGYWTGIGKRQGEDRSEDGREDVGQDIRISGELSGYQAVIRELGLYSIVWP